MFWWTVLQVVLTLMAGAAIELWWDRRHRRRGLARITQEQWEFLLRVLEIKFPQHLEDK